MLYFNRTEDKNMSLLSSWYDWSKNNVETIIYKESTSGSRNRKPHINFYKRIIAPQEFQENWFKNDDKFKELLDEDKLLYNELAQNLEPENRDRIIIGNNKKKCVKKNVRSLVRYVEICNNMERNADMYCFGKLRELKAVLLAALDNDERHNERTIDTAKDYIRNLPDSIDNIESDILSKNYSDYYEELYSWATGLYVYVYIAFLNKLPSFVGLGYSNYKEEVQRYEEEVLLRYGCFSDMGMEAIRKLADDGNVVAMYELGDQYFYGRTKYKKIDYNEAFCYYIKIENKKIKHPLASWSLAWILLNYENPKTMKNTKIDYIENYLKVNGKKEEGYYKELFKYLEESYRYGYAGAANLIGKILDGGLVPEEFLKNSFLKNYNRNDAIKFFEEAINMGYVYARNSLIVLKLKSAEEISDFNAKVENYKLIKQLLYDSYKEREWWATNQIGENYRKGLYVENEVIFEKNIYEAAKYYKLAIEYIGNANGSNWPLTNYLYYYLFGESVNLSEGEKSERSNLLKNALQSISDEKQLKLLTSIQI